MTRSHARALLGWFFGLSPILGCGPSPAGEHPNIILITLDTTRADKLGCYGGKSDVSPAVDGLARAGIVFDHAYAAVPLTLPEHTTILTGLYPSQHGVHDNAIYHASPELSTLAEVLKESGYQTAAFISAFVLEAQFGLDQGFDRYEGLTRKGDVATAQSGLIEERPAAATSALALEWLKTAREPFFAWVHFYDPHHPYAPVEPFKSRFVGREYEGEIASADAEVGRLLAALDQRSLRGRTYVAVTADHGEGLGEHGEMTHGYFLYNSTAHVPLVLAGPGLAAGARIAATVSHVDLMPTLLDLANVKDTVPRQGVSLKALIAGGAHEEVAYLESELPRINFGFRPAHGLVQEAWKYIDTGEQELYAPGDEPERNNVIAAEAQRAQGMARRIEEHREAQTTASASEKLDPAGLAHLQKLGYVGGNAAAPVRRESWKREELIEILKLRDEGKGFLVNGDFAQAEDRCRRLVQVSPDTYIGHELLGTVLARQATTQKLTPDEKRAKLEEAKRCLEKAIKIQNELKDSHFNMAVVLHFLGDDVGAKRELEETLRIDPGHRAARELLDQMKAKR